MAAGELPVIPTHCDYHCAFADFPPAETAGICRTMSAVWCRQLSELVHKNMPCEWRRRRPAEPADPPLNRPRRHKKR